jgi:hypothetical protein
MQVDSKMVMQVLKSYIIEFIETKGAKPEKLFISKEMYDLLKHEYSWSYEPVTMYQGFTRQIIAGSFYGLEVVVTEDEKLFTLGI